MSDDRSPWARPEPGHETAGHVTPGGSSAYSQNPQPARGTALDDRPAGYRAGTVTRLEQRPKQDVLEQGRELTEELARRNRLMLRWFGGGAAVVVIVGLVVLLAMVMTGHAGNDGPFGRRAAPPPDTRPQLAQLCPPPSVDPGHEKVEPPPPPPGPRTVDPTAGISYRAYGEPWEPWDQVWSAGTLHVVYRVGQHFITEPGPYKRGYHASILSGSVPAAANDALVLDLKCTGHQVAADVRAEYYFQPTTIEMMRDEQTMLGGRPAWVTKFRLDFKQAGLMATDELVGLALIDVGRPNAAIIYISVPGTHRQFDYVVDQVLDSVRPT